MINKQYKYSDITSKIIGCAMTVHRELGNGFQEVIYQRALEIDLEAYNLQVGLLINFGNRSLQFKRINNSKYKFP